MSPSAGRAHPLLFSLLLLLSFSPSPAANHLAGSASPYLLMHAGNPVDWWPWGPEAFAAAAAEDKPVLVSIGYAACHWCHVMEQESFSDPGLAAALNRSFIAIKVDREELPDVDRVYMAAALALHGSGGWPLNVFTTPDRRPFFATTYVPKDDLLELLASIAEAWAKQRGEVTGQADGLTRLVRALSRPPVTKADPDQVLEVEARTAARVADAFDPAEGGYRGAPKFPPVFGLELLLRQQARGGEARQLGLAALTLDRMAAGGIHDLLAGGFHRYSTDAAWHLPHFEKMLTDQALLAEVYAAAFRATGEARFLATARETLRAADAELGIPEGGFASSLDADSPGGEGASYLWTRAELDAALGAADGPLAAEAFGVTTAGNLAGRDPGLQGRNVLSVAVTPGALASRLGLDQPGLEARLGRARQALAAARAARPSPARDDKLVTAYQGLMVRALAAVGAAAGDPDLVGHGARAARRVLDSMRPGGRLQRSARGGKVGPPAFLDDHAYMILGLLELFQADGDPAWLAAARDLADRERLFAEPDGRFNDTGSDQPRLLDGGSGMGDGALPSPAAAAVEGLARLGTLLGEPAYLARARAGLEAMRAVAAQAPSENLCLLTAWEWCALDPLEIVVVGPNGSPRAAALMAAAAADPRGPACRVRVEPGRVPAVPWARDKPLLKDGDGAGVYVCRARTCLEPAATPEALRTRLGQAAAMAPALAK